MPAVDLFTALITLIGAAAVSAALTFALRPLLMRYALARPNARSSHRLPTPQGAGVAVIAATLIVAGLVILAGPGAAALPVALFAATLLIALVGAADDIRPMPVLARLGLQALTIGIVLSALPAGFQLLPAVPLWLERAVLLLAGLWFVNLVNFMDGLDWMTVAEVVPVTSALVLLGLVGGLPASATMIAAALCGAMLGFAPFNRPVAKVFLGDVGSLPIGLLLGWCLLELAARQHLAAALLLPLYYLADATVTLLRRAVKREKVWQAHRSHYYQLATDNGFRVIEVVGHVAALNVGLAILAALSVALASSVADIVLLVLGAAAVTMVLRRFSTLQR
jgi:UDP-N-acetylmuramyl pentapeptide phosphotransferase/UDP-N-acetylglucosamine-1-phosphate transferase